MDAAELLPLLIQRAKDGPEAVLAALEPPLAALGFAARATAGAPRAVLWTRGSPRLLFSGHVDVVPVGEGWTRAPFGGEEVEGRIWGRGACDMLGSVACFVAAAAQAPDAPLGILLTTDEETGMQSAIRALEERFLAGVDEVVVGEPTDFDVGIAEKGVLWLRLETQGRNAHGSMPELGENAAERLVRILHALQGAPLPGHHALLGAPTRNLGRVHGGDAVNQVPASAWAELDYRYLPGMTEEQIVRTLHEAARQARERARVEVVSHHPPFETSPEEPLVQRAAKALAATGIVPRLVGLPYGTEASRFAPHAACLILGPGERALAHTPRESIRVEDLRRGTAVYARLLADKEA